MRILVCGGRNYDDYKCVYKVLYTFYRYVPFSLDLTIVEGGCTGADSLARKFAKVVGCSVETHYAEWETHGKKAGPIRNQKMVDLGADFCIAFPGGRGTDDLVSRAREAGITVLSVS
jgi:predicted Rossmann-fold nucleotide-binding protein